MEAWRRGFYLAHHGIKGQRWGVRRGPPYPLDAKDHTAAEKKAGWRKSLNGGSGEETKAKKRLTKPVTTGKIVSGVAGNARRKTGDKKRHIPKFYSEEPEWTPIPDNDTNKRAPKKMSSKDVSKGKEIAKKALIGIGVVSVASLAAYALYSKHNAIESAKLEEAIKSSTADMIKKYEAKNTVELVQGLVQRNANTPISSLGQTFSNAKEFANHVSGIHHNTLSKEKQLFDKAVWDSVLSKDQRDAVKAYSGEHQWMSYRGMNKLLRMGEDKIPEQWRSTVKKLVNDCAEALNHSVLEEDAISYRGVPLHTISTMLGQDLSGKLTKDQANQLLQKKFTEKAFYSSAISESSAFKGVKITTIIPKGMKAMYIDPVSDFPGEKELLVQRGTSFKVKDFVTDATGVLIALTVEAYRQP